jgi:hypothetical protein
MSALTTSVSRTRRHGNMTAVASNPYAVCEQQFIDLLELGDVDFGVIFGCIPDEFEASITRALAIALTTRDSVEARSARTLLQRILYRINRLKLVWYDDLDQYYNENSKFLHDLHSRIEDAWYTWEIAQVALTDEDRRDPRRALLARVERDANTQHSSAELYFRDYADHAAYRRMLEIGALEALIETTQLSRMWGGNSDSIQSVLSRLMLEEHGSGERKNAHYYRDMLMELNMDTRPEAYLQRLPWETLAQVNLGFLLAERKRYFLRNIGGLLYSEMARPRQSGNFHAMAARLKLHSGTTSYWQSQMDADHTHGELILNKVAQPLMDRYPQVAWEMVLGYEHQKLVNTRARLHMMEEAQTVQAHVGKLSERTILRRAS